MRFITNKYICLNKNLYWDSEYYLIPVRKSDMYYIRNWRNSQIEVLRQKEKLTLKDQEKYFNELIQPSFSMQYPSQILFTYLKDKSRIGYGGFVHISWINRRAEMSFLLDPERVVNKNQYSYDFSIFIQLMKRICFSEIKFNRLFTETYEYRTFHISVLENSGFKPEGRMRQHIYHKGKYYDSLVHSVIREEYFEK